MSQEQNRLNLPIIHGEVLPPPVLDMKAYLEFLESNWELISDEKAYVEITEERARRLRVKTPFKAK